MRSVPRRSFDTALHPVHAILLAFPVALFPATLLCDVTFLNSSEMQWSNFAAWLNAGGLLTGGLALAWALLRMLRKRARSAWLAAMLGAMFVFGLIDAFKHSQDGWSSVGSTGLVLSIITAVLALAAGWIGFSGPRVEIRA